MKALTSILAITVGCSLLLAGCDLNLDPPTELGNDVVWRDPRLVEAYLNDVYSGVGYGFGDPMIAGLADEAKNTHGHGDAPMRLSSMTPTDRGLWSWGNEVITQYRWDIVYARIRDLNVLIQKVGARGSVRRTKEHVSGRSLFPARLLLSQPHAAPRRRSAHRPGVRTGGRSGAVPGAARLI